MKLREILRKLPEDERAFVERLIDRDPLTRAYNRRKLDQDLEAEISKVEREGGDVSLLKVDIDSFKQVNDISGYGEGDRVLKEVLSCLRNKLRPYNRDKLYRLSRGADEFVVLIPNTTLEQGGLIAERLRQTVEDSGLGVTISIGVANYQDSCNSAEELARHADEALRQAKRAKNQVRVYSE